MKSTTFLLVFIVRLLSHHPITFLLPSFYPDPVILSCNSFGLARVEGLHLLSSVFGLPSFSHPSSITHHPITFLLPSFYPDPVILSCNSFGLARVEGLHLLTSVFGLLSLFLRASIFGLRATFINNHP